jgi:1,4-alpha-glucan branching enzyme
MVDVLTGGEAVFRVYLPDATRVRLAGDFTRWRDDAIEMTPAGDGWWVRSLQLDPGDYAFCYLVDEKDWTPDYAAFGVELNDFGSWVSRVLVEGAREDARLLAA